MKFDTKSLARKYISVPQSNWKPSNIPEEISFEIKNVYNAQTCDAEWLSLVYILLNEKITGDCIQLSPNSAATLAFKHIVEGEHIRFQNYVEYDKNISTVYGNSGEFIHYILLCIKIAETLIVRFPPEEYMTELHRQAYTLYKLLFERVVAYETIGGLFVVCRKLKDIEQEKIYKRLRIFIEDEEYTKDCLIFAPEFNQPCELEKNIVSFKTLLETIYEELPYNYS